MCKESLGCRLADRAAVLDRRVAEGSVEGEAVAMLERIVTFCGQCNCGCPEVWVDHDAGADRRVVITDDFGQRVHMSLAQLATLVADVKSGVLDDLLAASR